MANSISADTAGKPAPGTLPPPPMPACPMFERHREAIDNYCAGRLNNKDLALVPMEVMPAIRAEIERACKPAPERYTRYVAFTLAGSWPQRESEHLPVYCGALCEEIAAYPPDVLRSAAKELRRSKTFLPAVAEVVTACEMEMQRKRRPLSVLDMMEAEHKRRDWRRKEAAAMQTFQDAYGQWTTWEEITTALHRIEAPSADAAAKFLIQAARQGVPFEDLRQAIRDARHAPTASSGRAC